MYTNSTSKGNPMLRDEKHRIRFKRDTRKASIPIQIIGNIFNPEVHYAEHSIKNLPKVESG